MNMFDGPTVENLCLSGEEAFQQDEIEDAVAWYELACAGTLRRRDFPLPEGVRLVEGLDELVANRFKRYEELRQMVPWRSVRRWAAADPNHLFVIMTCKGREQLFDRTMRSLLRAGLDVQYVRAVIADDGKPRGQAATFFRVLRQFATFNGIPRLTIFEDDIVLAESAIDYIASYRPDPDLVLTSWFSVETCTVPREMPVLTTIPATEYMFNQAVTMPARTVHTILDWLKTNTWPEKHGADRIYGHVFGKAPCARHFPSIVQHVGGAESLVGNNDHGLRTSPTFIGEDANALDLIRSV